MIACGHAFHLGCIDTCLLSNSTCSLCRGSLYLQGDMAAMDSTFDFGDSREEEDDEEAAGEAVAVAAKEGSLDPDKRVFPVRLGKFKSLVHLHHIRHAHLIIEYCNHIDQLICGCAIIGCWGGQMFVDCRKVKKKPNGT
ncbi:hypothetical protein Cni_G05773 [Canna indica]|uniref:RING-type domain-containing protein n=1 Tax=Canna indica TaxID=4628 RepID=A0AAQ3Q3H8_9LILI|nr:hypothetical protein Cni_G05773 [Canna indica]